MVVLGPPKNHETIPAFVADSLQLHDLNPIFADSAKLHNNIKLPIRSQRSKPTVLAGQYESLVSSTPILLALWDTVLNFAPSKHYNRSSNAIPTGIGSNRL